MKYAYFWSGVNGNASSRAYYDRQHSARATWHEGGEEWYASFQTEASRRHVYTTRNYYRGDTRTNLKAVKNSLSRLKAQIDALKSEAKDTQ